MFVFHDCFFLYILHEFILIEALFMILFPNVYSKYLNFPWFESQFPSLPLPIDIAGLSTFKMKKLKNPMSKMALKNVFFNYKLHHERHLSENARAILSNKI